MPKIKMSAPAYECQKKDVRNHLDDFLAPFFLGPRPGTHPSLEERGIFLDEVERDRGNRRPEGGQKSPSLPVAERPRREEQEGAERSQELRESGERPRPEGHSISYIRNR
jgi:hypothetical protein